MRSITIIAVTLIVWHTVFPYTRASAQDAALRAQYRQALEAAQSKNFNRAYEVITKVVSADLLYYEAAALRIALATILDKTGPEDPKNLIKLARPRSPLGSDIERDVQNMIGRLTGAPATQPAPSSPTGPDPYSNPTPATIEISPYVHRKLALVVGIGKFQDTRIQSLRFAANDARVFAGTLKNECKFDHVRTLIDEKATTTEIKNEIDNLAKMTTPEDLVVIYFASHGSPEEIDSAGINYIVTYDTDVDKLYGTAFKMEDLLSDVKRRIRAERVVAFLDTCYSGGTFRELPSGWAGGRALIVRPSGPATEAIRENLRGSDRGVKVKPTSPGRPRMAQDVGRVIIAASRQDEQSYEFAESKGIPHGYFTYFLIEALKQRRAISIEKIFTDVKDKVSEAVHRDMNGKQQNPTMVKSRDSVVNIYLRDGT